MEELQSIDFHYLGPFNLPETSPRGNSSGMNAASCPLMTCLLQPSKLSHVENIHVT